MKQVLAVVGNRSELARLAPALRMLRDQYGLLMRVSVMHTGEKTEMVWSTGAMFGVVPERQHALSEDTLTFADVSWQISNAVGHELDSRPVDLVIVQGSSLSSTLAAQQAFLRHVPVVHVDSVAGSFANGGDSFVQSNRRMLSAVASFRCVPDRDSADSLRGLGYPAYEIGITGSTAVEAAKLVLSQVNGYASKNSERDEHDELTLFVGLQDADLGRENSSELAFALANIAHEYPSLKICVMTSYGYKTGNLLRSILGSLTNVELVTPSDYYGYLKLLGASTVVLTNSEDVAEEAMALSRPVIVLQETCLEESFCTSFGANNVTPTQDSIVDAVEAAIDAVTSKEGGQRSASNGKANVIGDGKASLRIVRLLSNWARNRVLTAHAFEPFCARFQHSSGNLEKLSTEYMH